MVFGPVSFEREDEVEKLGVGLLFRIDKSAGFQSFFLFLTSLFRLSDSISIKEKRGVPIP